MAKLNSPRSIYTIIGSLCKDLDILKDSSIYLDEDDFYSDEHKIIFNAIDNISKKNNKAKSISEIDIDNHLASYPQLYKIWEDSQGQEYVKNAIKLTNLQTFDKAYDMTKKMTLLRMYQDEGISVKEIYDTETTDILNQTKQMKQLEEYTISEIMDIMSMKTMKIRDNFNMGAEVNSFLAGDDLDTLLDDLQKSPEYGYPFRNKVYNSVFRGMRKKKFMLRSGNTGSGKTRIALADLCNVCISDIYNIEEDKWESNGTVTPGMYISTEIEKREVQTILLAFISGVDEDVIKDGIYGEKIRKRLNKAIEILKKSPLYCVYIDDFSISDIEQEIEKYILKYDVRTVAFDYVQLTPKLSRTMANMFGGSMREDQILVQFSAALKILTNRYDIFLLSSTQLNRNSKDYTLRDTTSLRGGRPTKIASTIKKQG